MCIWLKDIKQVSHASGNIAMDIVMFFKENLYNYINFHLIIICLFFKYINLILVTLQTAGHIVLLFSFFPISCLAQLEDSKLPRFGRERH